MFYFHCIHGLTAFTGFFKTTFLCRQVAGWQGGHKEKQKPKPRERQKCFRKARLLTVFIFSATGLGAHCVATLRVLEGFRGNHKYFMISQLNLQLSQKWSIYFFFCPAWPFIHSYSTLWTLLALCNLHNQLASVLEPHYHATSGIKQSTGSSQGNAAVLFSLILQSPRIMLHMWFLPVMWPHTSFDTLC